MTSFAAIIMPADKPRESETVPSERVSVETGSIATLDEAAVFQRSSPRERDDIDRAASAAEQLARTLHEMLALRKAVPKSGER